MHITSRSYLTAGLAVLGVGAITLAPIQPISNHVALAPQRVVENLAVDLTAAVDPITLWVETLQTTGPRRRGRPGPVVELPAPAEEVAPVAQVVVDEVTDEVDPVVVDLPEVEAPAEVAEVADDPEPAASVGAEDADDSGDSRSRASDSRRGAGSTD